MFLNNVLVNGLPDPGTALLSMSASAGFLTIPFLESNLPALPSGIDSGMCRNAFLSSFEQNAEYMGITVAGTVPDSNRIPFYASNGMLRLHHLSGGKDIHLLVYIEIN